MLVSLKSRLFRTTASVVCIAILFLYCEPFRQRDNSSRDDQFKSFFYADVQRDYLILGHQDKKSRCRCRSGPDKYAYQLLSGPVMDSLLAFRSHEPYRVDAFPRILDKHRSFNDTLRLSEKRVAYLFERAVYLAKHREQGDLLFQIREEFSQQDEPCGETDN